GAARRRGAGPAARADRTAASRAGHAARRRDRQPAGGAILRQAGNVRQAIRTRRTMGRILGVVFVVVVLFITQTGYDFYLSRNYTEIEATLVAYEEDCYVEKKQAKDVYFDCSMAAKMAARDPDGKIERHAKLTYQYRVPSESDVREARTQSWAV